jgi:hypothetical protein
MNYAFKRKLPGIFLLKVNQKQELMPQWIPRKPHYTID